MTMTSSLANQRVGAGAFLGRQQAAVPVVEHVQVVIVGAGAAGLNCAHLLRQAGLAAENIVILEGRDRIGGRIHTQTHHVATTTGHNEANTHQTEIILDHGAAWVHGTGVDSDNNPECTGWNTDRIGQEQLRAGSSPSPNPMMNLLQQNTPRGKDARQHHLNWIVHGNPWTRPKTVLHQPKQIHMFHNGQAVTDPKVLDAAVQEHYDILDRVTAYADDMYRRGRGLEMTHESLQRAIDRVTANKPPCALVKFHMNLIECWNGVAASELQLSSFADEAGDDEDGKEGQTSFDGSLVFEDGDFRGPHCTLRHGMKSVLEPLLEQGVQERIRLGQVVKRVSQDGDSSVLVETHSGRIQAKCCVLTLSGGCLEHAASSGTFFGSPLSVAKQNAIANLQMGIDKKVFLMFDSIFWPASPSFLGLIRDDDHDSSSNDLGPYLFIENLWARHGYPCFEAVLYGSNGDWAVGKPDADIQAAVLQFVQDAMPLEIDVRQHCIDCHITRWEEDPLSRGAYSYLRPGSQLQHELKRPEWNGRLVLSGEATNVEHQGSVHGALMSGQDAQEQVLRVLSRRETEPLDPPRMVHSIIEMGNNHALATDRGQAILSMG